MAQSASVLAIQCLSAYDAYDDGSADAVRRPEGSWKAFRIWFEGALLSAEDPRSLAPLQVAFEGSQLFEVQFESWFEGSNTHTRYLSKDVVENLREMSLRLASAASQLAAKT